MAVVTKRIVMDGIKYLLAFGLLAVVIWGYWGKPDDGQGLAYVWQRHIFEGQPINFVAFGLTLAALTVGALLTFLRWYFLVRAAGLPFRLTDALRLGLIGFFFNNLLPGGVGGDVVKAVFIAREQSRRAIAVATILVDRFLAVWGILWFVTVLGWVFWAGGFLEVEGARALKTIVLVASGGIAASVVGWVALGLLSDEHAERFEKRLERRWGRLGARVVGAVCWVFVKLGMMSPERVDIVKERLEGKIGHSIAEFWNAIWIYRQQPRVVGLTLLISFVGFVAFSFTFHFASRVLWDGQQQIPSLLEHFIIVPIGLLIQGVPLFPGGVGIGELGFGGLYQVLRYPPSLGILGSLVQRVCYWILGIVGLLTYMQMRPGLKPEVETPELVTSDA
jgi:uncharacterized membrane protein YbhN (UPF0104 family)